MLRCYITQHYSAHAYIAARVDRLSWLALLYLLFIQHRRVHIRPLCWLSRLSRSCHSITPPLRPPIMVGRQLAVVALLVVACHLLAVLVSAQYDPNSQLSFYPRTTNASWSPRWDSNIEFYNKRLSVVLPNGTTLVWPGRIFILQGQGSGTAAQRSNDGRASNTRHRQLQHCQRCYHCYNSPLVSSLCFAPPRHSLRSAV